MISPQLRAWRLGAGLFSAFGVLALFVAAIGLYSVVAFDVEGRRREMGVRAALGASSGAILRLIVTDGLRLAAGGVALGLVVAWFLAPLGAELLYDVAPKDAAVFAGASRSVRSPPRSSRAASPAPSGPRRSIPPRRLRSNKRQLPKPNSQIPKLRVIGSWDLGVGSFPRFPRASAPCSSHSRS